MNALTTLSGGFFVVFFTKLHLATTFDFEIVSNTLVQGLTLVMPMNETAFDYVKDECNYTVLKDGSVPLFADHVGDFISDAESAHFACSYN